MQLSVCSCLNLKLVKNDTNVLFQDLGACFKPYKALFSFKTLPGFNFCLRPFGGSIYTSSSNVPYKKAVHMSTWWIFNSSFNAIAIRSRIDFIFTTGENVSP